MILYLKSQLNCFFDAGLPLFDQLMNLRGECIRQQKNRTTWRVKIGDQVYYLKQHRGIGLKEVCKNVLQGKLPIISAKNEWQAITKLTSLSIETARLAAYGERGRNPFTKESFVLLEEIRNAMSLEEMTENWHKQRPGFIFKHNVIKEVARITRILHAHGINHRDFYICHFLCQQPFKLFLIDLHRAGLRARTPFRWVIKDLAGLYFSSKDIALTNRDLYRFMRYYRQMRLKTLLQTEKHFWQKVMQRGEQLYAKHK